jgi:hypothetical protein
VRRASARRVAVRRESKRAALPSAGVDEEGRSGKANEKGEGAFGILGT